MPPIAFVAIALALAVGLAAAASPFASSAPDGLERVARDAGFSGAAREHPVQRDAPAAGYRVPGIGDERVATGVAGFTGTLGVFAVGAGLAWLLRRRADRGAAAGR